MFSLTLLKEKETIILKEKIKNQNKFSKLSLKNEKQTLPEAMWTTLEPPRVLPETYKELSPEVLITKYWISVSVKRVKKT